MKTIVPSRTCVVIVSVCLGACGLKHPAWDYRAPVGKLTVDDGARYDLPEQSGAQARVHASLYAGGLSVEVDVLNREPEELTINLDNLIVSDRDGQALKRSAASSSVQCGGRRVGTACFLAAGQQIGRAHV